MTDCMEPFTSRRERSRFTVCLAGNCTRVSRACVSVPLTNTVDSAANVATRNASCFWNNRGVKWMPLMTRALLRYSRILGVLATGCG